MNFISKSSAFSVYLKASTAAAGCQALPLATPSPEPEKSLVVQPPPLQINSYTLGKSLPNGRILANSGGIGAFKGTTQYRCAHTDIKFPDYTHYRLKDTKDPNADSSKTEVKRRVGPYALQVAGALSTIYVGKNVLHAALGTLAPSKAALDLASIEVKIDGIPEGTSKTFKWRGKPLFIMHRTQEDIDREAAVPLDSLRDPQHDKDRVQKPEWLVLVGVCTHLGCVPLANAGDFGGYYCPCHGSHYDGSGRIRKGPAPLNLEVPPYTFLSDDLVKIG